MLKDFQIQTEKQVMANLLDIVVLFKLQKKTAGIAQQSQATSTSIGMDLRNSKVRKIKALKVETQGWA